MRSVPRFTLVVLVVLATSIGLWAQAGTGEISGIISDPMGAVVANAQVTITNDATGVTRSTKPTAAGVYTFPAVPVGSYTLVVSAAGFKEFRVAKLVVSTGAVFAQDAHLQVGGAKETVTVEAGAMGVQTTESSISALIGSNIWGSMPLETRNQNTFINLVAGATPDVVSTRGASVNGARGGTGNYMVEGMDNNDQGQGGRGQLSGYDSGGAATSISPDAIQEYRVITNSFSAEYGKAGGFVTDTVVKSGTNNFHGALFEYNRVQALAANSFFSNRAGNKDSLVRNQFGGAIGGPIIKDKTFFFYQLEFHRARQAGSLHAVGTTQQYLDWVNSGGLQTWAESSPDGICMQYTGAACPGKFAAANKLAPIFNSMVKVSGFPVAPALPCTDASDPCTGQGEYTGAVSALTSTRVAGANLNGLHFPVALYGDVFANNPYHLNEYKMTGKFDHKFSDRDQINFLWLMQKADSGDTFGGGGGTIGPPYLNDGVGIDTGLTWTHTLSPTILNTFKISYLRHRSDFPSPNPALDAMPMVLTWDDPISVGLGLYSGLPQYFTDNQFQFQDHLSFVRGKHSFKTGWEYRRTRNGSAFHNDGPGTFYPWDVNDLVTDLAFTDLASIATGKKPYSTATLNEGSVAQASAAVDTTTRLVPQFYRGYRANEFAGYFQDDWRMSPRFTLNWGVRYEYFGPPHNFQKNIDSNFYFGQAVPSAIVTASTNIFYPRTPFAAEVNTGAFQIRNNEIWNKDTNNFAPRLGFAWDMLGNQKLVMRAGAGVMYDRLYNNVFENIRFNPPYFSDNTAGILANGVPIGAINSPGIYGYPFTATAYFGAPGANAPLPNPRHIDQNLVTAYSEQFHFGFQYEIAKGYVFEPEYVGTFGKKLTGYFDINTFDGRVAGAAASTTGVSSSTRINSHIAADNFRTNAFSSKYNGLQLSLRKNYANGFGFQANYTWSKVLDTLSDVFNWRSPHVADVQNIGYDYGPADFNLKHRFVANLSYELPWMKSNRWIGGWSINTILSIQSGAAFEPYTSSTTYDPNKDGLASDRYVTTGASAMGTLTGHNAADGYFDKTQWKRFSCAPALWCDPPIGRNNLTGPGYWNQDLGITKKFKVNERMAFSFSGNMFNVFNHTNFLVDATMGNAASTSFGRSTTAADPRITQLALRFDF
ncbi:MAG: TonB-dependent receptor [Acidobacteriia bacterium]|nr:TonB-dependent receptor [Terriglobia bacterium]